MFALPLRLILAPLVVLLGACGSENENGESTGPATEAPTPTGANVLLISWDSVRADHLGCYGHRSPFNGESPSPTLDRLATEGALFEAAYSSSSWTLPSHMALITGQPDVVHGVEMGALALAKGHMTLAEHLKGMGYSTAGYFTGPYLDPRYGFGRGFDQYGAAYGKALEEQAATEQALRLEVEAGMASGSVDPDLMARHERAYQELSRLSHVDRTSEGLTDKLLAALEGFDESAPWFLFGHYFDPHYDYVPPAEFAERFDPEYDGSIDAREFHTSQAISQVQPSTQNPFRRKRVASDRDWQHVLALYDAEIAWTDSQLARVIDAVEARGELDNTIIVVVADHGDEFFEHGHLGHRLNLYEESTRVPLVVRYPKRFDPGTRVELPVAAYDAFSTVLEAVGAPPASVTSVSLTERVAGRERPGPLSRLVRPHSGLNAGGVQLRTSRAFETYREGAIKITRTVQWGDPISPTTPERLKQLAENARRARQRDLDLRWVNLEAHPGEPPGSASRDFSSPAAAKVLEQFQRFYPALLSRRLPPSTVARDAGQDAILSGLGYGGGGEADGDTADLFRLGIPGSGQ